MDADGDAAVELDELISWLAAQHESDPQAAALQAKLRNREACVAAGSAFGMLHLLGWFFADPIRLFRGTYMDYFVLVKVRAAHQAGCDAEALGIWDAIRHEVRRAGLKTTVAGVGTAVAIDGFIGVSMFTAYCWSRTWLQGRTAGRLRLEATAGALAGVVSGSLNALMHGLTNYQRASPSVVHLGRRTAAKLHRFLLHDVVGHAAFFASFNAGKQAGVAGIHRLGFHRDTLTEAVITAGSGAGAGACYRLVTVPQQQFWQWWSQRPAAAKHANPVAYFLRTVPPAQRLPVLYRGLGESLKFSMPLTGVVFLVYEYFMARQPLFSLAPLPLVASTAVTA
eukprot:EG_transcript_14687